MVRLNNDLKFFTNEPGRDLYSRFCNILKSHTKYFDIIVGYFRTSGFFRMYEAMEKIEKIRILVGLNVDKKTAEIISAASAFNGSYKFEPTVLESKEQFKNVVENEFDNSPLKSDIERGVKIFIDWLHRGKIELRMYNKAPLHAKVYIMRKNPEEVPDTFGSVITGSSNFSEAGLRNNLEFNVELKDAPDVEFALNQFEKLWAESVPVSDEFVETVTQRTWLKDDITPYELYLKTLYEFFKEEINADQESLFEELLPEQYARYQYQIDAVIQAKKILEAYNGVFISDVVGLGKTYICAMLAKILPPGRKLIICPPALIEYWKNVLEKFGVIAKVESIGKLDKIIDEGVEKFKYVFVDEAHRFRNDDNERYAMLHNICYNKKVILISATPINNYSADIENQIYLFQSRNNSTIIGLKRLELFFGKLRGKLKNIDRGTPEYFKQLKENSEEIRDKILRHIMIRRTRSEIVKYYADDMKAQGLSFPQLGDPEQIAYIFDDDLDKIFNETVKIINDFHYARYTPLLYLKNADTKAATGQRNLRGFMKSILVKRLESSFFAFKKTLERFEISYIKFIDMYNSGNVFISKKINVYEFLENDDLDKLFALVDEELIDHFKSKDFGKEFINHLEEDLKSLQYLRSKWDKINIDPKLDQLKREFKTNKKLKGNKKILFTESKETAEYIAEKLKDTFNDRLIVYTGSSPREWKNKIEQSFDPNNSNPQDKYDLLITTDVLAEGVNLHRSNVIINYDLSWNPTRIMQRVGRINRVGTKHKQIFIFNFFPTAQMSEHLPLEDRIKEKLQFFCDTLGTDTKYLSEEEEITAQGLFTRLNANLEDDENASPELEYLNKIRDIRDNHKILFEKIKRLPKRARSAKISDKILGNATLSFIRRGGLKSFLMTISPSIDTSKPKQISLIATEEVEQLLLPHMLSDNTTQLSFIEAIKYLECEADEKRIKIDDNYFERYELNSQEFEKLLLEEQKLISPKLSGKQDKKMIDTLRFLLKNKKFTDDEEEIIKKMIELWQNGDIPSKLTNKILKLTQAAKNEIDMYYKIKSALDEKYFVERQTSKTINDDKKQVILSCDLNGGD